MQAERSAVRLAALNAGGRVLSLGIQLAHFALLARLFTPERFGDFAAGLALATIVGVAGELGLPTTLLVERAAASRSAIWSTGLRAVGATTAVAVAGGAAVAAGVLDTEARLAALALLVWTVAARVRLVAAAVRLADHEITRTVAAELISRSVALASAGLASVVAGGSSYGRIVAWVVAGMVVGELLAVAALWPGRPRSVSNREVMALLGRTRDFGLTAATASAHARADQVMLASFRVVQGGAYAVAYRLVDAALAVATVVSAMFVPVLSRRSAPERQRLARSIIALFAALGLLAASVVLVAAPALIAVVGGEGYEHAVPLVRILALVLLAAVVNVPLLHIVVVERKTIELFKISVVMVALNLSLNLLLIPANGATGAAIATLVSELVGLALVASVARRLQPNVLPGWSLWRELGPLREVSFEVRPGHGNAAASSAQLATGAADRIDDGRQ